MLDECLIVRPSTDSPTIDGTTGEMTPGTPTVVYAGPCTLAAPGAADQPLRSDTALTESKPVLRVPVGTGPYQLGDTVTLTSVWDGNTDRVTGRSWRVINLPERTARIDQRLELAEVTDAG